MKSLLLPLSILLAVQLLLSVVLSAFQTDMSSFTPEEDFIALSLEDLDEILITVREDKTPERSLILKKESDIWILPDYYRFPVSGKKLRMLQEQLFQLKKPYPVGSTKLAANQFEVSEKTFQTRVEFKQDGKVVETLYLGTSPSFKKVHARTQSDERTYAISFSNYELKAKDNAWLNREYLHLPPTKIQKIEFRDISLERSQVDAVWQLGNLNPDKEELDLGAANSLINDLTKINFLDILGQEVKKEYNLSKPALSYSISLFNGSKIQYEYGKVKGETYYVLRVSDEPNLFKISGYQVDKIKDVSSSALIEEKNESIAKEAAHKGNAGMAE